MRIVLMMYSLAITSQVYRVKINNKTTSKTIIILIYTIWDYKVKFLLMNGYVI
jgi:hypothetical protein